MLLPSLQLAMTKQRQSSITYFFSLARKRQRASSDQVEGCNDLDFDDGDHHGSNDLEQDYDCASDSHEDPPPEYSTTGDSDPEANSESHGCSSTAAQRDELSSSCSSECCKNDLSEPYHPTNILLSKEVG